MCLFFKSLWGKDKRIMPEWYCAVCSLLPVCVSSQVRYILRDFHTFGFASQTWQRCPSQTAGARWNAGQLRAGGKITVVQWKHNKTHNKSFLMLLDNEIAWDLWSWENTHTEPANQTCPAHPGWKCTALSLDYSQGITAIKYKIRVTSCSTPLLQPFLHITEPPQVLQKVL